MVVHACNPRYSGGWGRRIAWTQEVGVVVSQDHAIVLQPGWQSKTLSHQKKKKKKITLSHIYWPEFYPNGKMLQEVDYLKIRKIGKLQLFPEWSLWTNF